MPAPNLPPNIPPNLMTTRLHLQYERSVNCSCHACTAACLAAPGHLAPGDIDRIAAYLGADPDDEEFLGTHFRASEGARVLFRGELLIVPTIVPAQYDDNGRCMFLDKNNHCSIHPVPPFGCSRFRVCDPPSRDDELLSIACLRAILNSIDYVLIWTWLWERGLRAPPLVERKARMQRLIDLGPGQE